MARVIELISYPVKGCAGTSVPATALTGAGLAHDRTFMVIDQDGEARTQRRDPLLALVRPEIGAGGERLSLTFGAPATRAAGVAGVAGVARTAETLGAAGAAEVAADIEPLHITVDVDSPRRAVTLFKQPLRGIDQGEAAADWFSRLLGAPSRLIRVPPENDRLSKGDTLGPVGYADSCAILLASPPSLDLLNERLAETGAEPLPMNRFRPNIVVGGWTRPHTEDLVRKAGIGSAELSYAKLCLRCAVTMIDQETAVPSGPQPIRALSGYRRALGGVAFGSHFAVTRPGELAVGDEVHVSSWGESVV